MPHSTRALLTMHELTVDGGRVEAGGLLFPLRIPIYLQHEGKRKRVNLVNIGEAWGFRDADLGIEANIYLDEDEMPQLDRASYLYPDIDLAARAIDGNEHERVIVRAEVRAVFLDSGCVWDRMPPMYWPQMAKVLPPTIIRQEVVPWMS